MSAIVNNQASRIASVAFGYHLLVFGFWTGELPEVSRLHFLTIARTLPSNSRYVLFTYKAFVSGKMLTLLSRCGVEVVALDVPQLVQEQGLKKLLRKTPLSSGWALVRRVARLNGSLTRPLGHDHPVMGFTPRYNFVFGGPPLQQTTLSNYVRVLISSLVPINTLYTDLDFAFTRSLEWIFRYPSFVYSWERRSFASSALLFARKDAQIKKGVLLDLLRREGTGRNWILFSLQNCRACGLEILSCDRLDPLWSLTNKSEPNFSEFFRCRDNSSETLRRLKREFDAIHWHNRWSEQPDRGSPYDLWMRELTRG